MVSSIAAGPTEQLRPMTSAPSAVGGEAVFARRQLRHDRQGRHRPHAADGGAELGHVAEGLEHEQVDAGERLGLLAEGRLGLVQAGLAPRLDADAERADRAGHVGLAAGRLPGDADARGVDLAQAIAQAELGQLEAVGAEGVGLEDVRPGPEVGLVNLGDDVGLGQVQLVERAVEKDALAVEHRAHRAVADEHTRIERVEEGGHALADAAPGRAPAEGRDEPDAGTRRSCLSQMKSLLL
jgi:hypothetical protein